MEIDKPQLAVYAAAAIAIALIGARYLRDSRPAGDAGGAAKAVPVRVSGEQRPGGPVVIQVAGEVRRPGVYRLSAGQRVQDAVRLAGGLTPKADLAGVNLAQKAEDGRQVIVPARGATVAAAGSVASTSASGAPPSAPINLNTATPEQLDQLDGVGPATAQKILAWRKEHGGFRSVDDLKQISGIGPKRFESLKDKVGM